MESPTPLPAPRRAAARFRRAAAASLLAVALAQAGPLGAADAKKPFAIADLYRLKGVEEPVVSPDGKTIVYKVTTSDLPSMKRLSNLWRVDADGRNARPLTFSEKSDSAPVFSPDGSTLAFVSTRAGDPQIWLLPLAGGEARKVTDVPGGVAGPVFSRDGKRIAFAAEVYSECGADAACTKKIDDAKEKSKLKAYVADRLLYRHWNAWKEGKRTHVFVLDLTNPGAAPRDVTPGDFDSPVFSLGGGPEYAFSPDGASLVFSSNREADEASTTNADLFAVDLSAPPDAPAAPRKLTGGNAAWDGSPAFSPDGRTLAYRTQRKPGYEADRFRIALLDVKSSATRVPTEAFDDTIGDYAWSSDGKRIFFLADVKGRTPLHELDVATGAIRTISAVGQVTGFDVAPDGSFAVVSRRQVGRPQELYRIDVKTGAEARLTRHNEAVENEVDIRPAEEIFVPGAGGKPVQVWIVKPHGFDPAKKYPLVLNVHGGPQMQWADAFRGDWQVYPGAGYVVAFPNPHGSTGFGQAYTEAISRDWNGKVMEDIAKVTEHLAALPYVDANRMGAMGWSWGGYAMMWLAGRPTRFKALASMMGVYDLRSMYSSTEELWFPEWDLGGTPWENPDGYRTQSPSSYVTAFNTPTLVLTGQLDFRVPYTQSLMFFTDLQKRRVPSRLVVLPNAGHWPAWHEMALYYAAHLDWFHRYLGGAPSPWDPVALAKGAGFGSP